MGGSRSFDGTTMLLVSLAALFVLGPLLDGITAPVAFSTVLFLGLMLALVRALGLHGSVLFVGIALIVLGFCVETAVGTGLFVGVRSGVLIATTLGYLLFVGTAVVGLVRAVIQHETVTAATVRGGIAVYLLLAIVWSLLFEIVALTNPEAFAGLVYEDGVDPTSVRVHYLYFSLTTLTTLGYGDIVPATMIARNLATLEATCGQIFLAVFMARLIAIRVGQELKQR